MLSVSPNHWNHKDLKLSATILDIDAEDVENNLRNEGASPPLTATIMEVRRKANHHKNYYLRDVQSTQEGHWVECVETHKLDSLSIPGSEALGPRLRQRRESTVITRSQNGESPFPVMKNALQLSDEEMQDSILIRRVMWDLRGVKCAIKEVLSFQGKRDLMPPRFLQIKGSTDTEANLHAVIRKIIAVVHTLGFEEIDCVLNSTRDVVRDNWKLFK